MSLSLKKLAGETVIYGATTITGRLLNWLLMPFYIRTLTTYEYGVVVNLYGIVSILLVILTYGLETGFFRFSGKSYNENSVFKTLLSLLGITSGLFVFFGFLFHQEFSQIFYNGQHSLSILMVFIVLGFDSFIALPFAKLRLQNKPVRFSAIKLINIGSNISFNLIFLLLIPYFIRQGFISGRFVDFYNNFDGVFYVFFSNALSSVITFIFLLPEFIRLKTTVNWNILKPVLIYSFPVLFVGVTGMITQNVDKIILPALLEGDNGFDQLAVYGANFKIGVLMSLFTQSFRFAFEPFFFKNKEKGIYSYAKIMEYFIFFGLIIFLGVTLFLDAINIVLTAEYLKGNTIVPIVLLSLLLYGIYFNLSLWYKLTDKTWFGAIFGSIGAIITIGLNVFLVPRIGILGSAVALFFGYFAMVFISWLIGKKYYPIPYNLSRYGLYFILAGIVFLTDILIDISDNLFSYLFKALIFVLFIGSFFVIKSYDKS